MGLQLGIKISCCVDTYFICAYFCLQLTLVQKLIVSMMVTVIWMKTIRLIASVPTNMKESFARTVGFFIKYDLIMYMNDTIVCIRYSRITFSFNFIIEIECNLTCEHDGICAKDHNDDLQCFCPQGYSGQYCEHGKRISILDIPHTYISDTIFLSSNQNG